MQENWNFIQMLRAIKTSQSAGEIYINYDTETDSKKNREYSKLSKEL